MQEDLYNWYKEGFETLPQESPPPLVWENVTAVLDGKAPQKKRIAIWWWSGLGILLVSMGLIAFNVSTTKVDRKSIVGSRPNQVVLNNAAGTTVKTEKAIQQKKATPTIDTENEQSVPFVESKKSFVTSINKAIEKAASDEKSSSEPVSTTVQSNTLVDNDLPAENNSKPIAQRQSVETQNSSLIANSIEELATLPAQRFPESFPELTVGETAALPLGVYPLKNKSPNPLWYFGLASEANNNWLFNHELRDALRKSSTNSLRPHFSSTWSLMAAHQIHPGKTLRAELLLAKQEGQHYLTYTEGLIQQKTIHLNYSGATLLYDQSISRTKVLFKYPIRTHWLIGTSLCFLSGSKLAIGQEEINPQGYRKLNVSLVGGFEKEVFFSERLSLGTGLRLYGGLTNIFKGYSNIPSWFNRTHTGNIALTISMRYYLDLKPQN